MFGFILLLAILYVATVIFLRAALPVECRPHHIHRKKRRDYYRIVENK